VRSFTQLNPQATSGALHVSTHEPLWQNGAIVPQGAPHLPQLLGSLASDRHTPSHSAVPTGHAHEPLLHVCPLAQMSSHLPQFFGSLWVKEQTPSQSVWPTAAQLATH